MNVKRRNKQEIVEDSQLNQISFSFFPDIFPPAKPPTPTAVGFTWEVPEKAKLFDETF